MSRPRVPFFGVDREYAELREPVLAAVDVVLRSGRMLQGEPIARLERRLAATAGRRFAIATSSCTDALYFALVAAGVQPGDEVLVPDFSFVATASSVLRAGAIPVFVDIDEGYRLDLELAVTALTAHTRAMVYVQLYGGMGDPEQVERFAREHGITLIEDAAQSFGAVVGGRRSGSVGSASCYSFDPTKVLSAPGSGGAVLTDDPDLADTIRRLRWHGRSAEGFVDLGYNAGMSNLVAAVLSVKLDRTPDWLCRRRAIAAAYSAVLQSYGITAPDPAADDGNVFHKYVLRTPARADLASALDRAGVQTLVHYPYRLHELPFVARRPHRVVDAGRAAAAAATVLSLPLHAQLSDADVEAVLDALRRTLDGWSRRAAAGRVRAGG